MIAAVAPAHAEPAEASQDDSSQQGDAASEVAAKSRGTAGESPASSEADAADALGDREPARTYPISGVSVTYFGDPEGLPHEEKLLSISVQFYEAEPNVYVAPAPSAAAVPVTVTLDAIGSLGSESGPANFTAPAVTAISLAIRDYLANNQSLMGHLVTPSVTQIDVLGDGVDLRDEGDSDLAFVVYPASIAASRTLAYGDRLQEPGQPPVVNAPSHGKLLSRIPLATGDILRRGPIEDFAARLDRHPGRRVDISVSPSGEPGSVNVDYLITEPKTWALAYQFSNTGTDASGEYRHRFSFEQNQLTGNDDILTFDYITSDFDLLNALFLAYERPLTDRISVRFSGMFDEFTAEDIGLPGFDFNGQNLSIGSRVIFNVAQRERAFFDVFGGFRYSHQDTDFELTGDSTDEDFLFLEAGVSASRRTAVSSIAAEISLSSSLDGIAGTDANEVGGLGRTSANADFTVLRGSAGGRIYLDPLLGGGDDGEGDSLTLANELVFRLGGQYVLGERRVTPGEQAVAGGFFTVRGYDEAFLAGDNFIGGSIEYQYSLARSLPASDAQSNFLGQPFRLRRQVPFGSADWDLIFRTFVDFARVTSNESLSFESDDTLIGAGVGVEARLLQNLSARLDYGVAVTKAQNSSSTTNPGDARLHFMVFFRY